MDLQEAYVHGLEDGIRAYSWMKDGVTYVGTTGRTLDEALANARNGVYPPQRNMQTSSTGRFRTRTATIRDSSSRRRARAARAARP